MAIVSHETLTFTLVSYVFLNSTMGNEPSPKKKIYIYICIVSLSQNDSQVTSDTDKVDTTWQMYADVCSLLNTFRISWSLLA